MLISNIEYCFNLDYYKFWYFCYLLDFVAIIIFLFFEIFIR